MEEEKEFKEAYYIYAGIDGSLHRGYIVNTLQEAKSEYFPVNSETFNQKKKIFKKARIGYAFKIQWNGETIKFASNADADSIQAVNWKLRAEWDTRHQANLSAEKAKNFTELQDLKNILNPIREAYWKASRDKRQYILAEIIRIITL